MIMEIIENTMYFLPVPSTLFIQPAEKYNPTNATDSPITAEKPEPYRITNRAIIIIFVDTTNCKTEMHKKPINKPRLNTNGVTERIFPSIIRVSCFGIILFRCIRISKTTETNIATKNTTIPIFSICAASYILSTTFPSLL